MFIVLHRVLPERNRTSPVSFNTNTINAILKTDNNEMYNTMIISGNTKFMIEESFETVIHLIERNENVFSTATFKE